jgi:hypothetical protein
MIDRTLKGIRIGAAPLKHTSPWMECELSTEQSHLPRSTIGGVVPTDQLSGNADGRSNSSLRRFA